MKDKERKVYVLIGTSVSNVVVFGNDYLLTFDEKTQLLTKKKLHANIMVAQTQETDSTENKIVGGIHSHYSETGEFITATDICTLMLYGPFTTWESYTVVSEKYMNVWMIKDQKLVVLPRE